MEYENRFKLGGVSVVFCLKAYSQHSNFVLVVKVLQNAYLVARERKPFSCGPYIRCRNKLAHGKCFAHQTNVH